MILVPFPFIIAELVIFILAVNHWGFLNTLGFYLLPCLLGFLIVATVGRLAMMSMQTSLMRGELPANRILNSGAIFIAGLLLLIPSFFARVGAVILLLPGLRHLALWKFKSTMKKKMAQGSRGFGFGGPFGFGTGMGSNTNTGFRYYEFRGQGPTGRPGGFEEFREEREINAEVLDVTPLEITHDDKKDDTKE